MFKAINQFFSFFFHLFSAADRLAKSADQLAQLAEEQSAVYVDELRKERLQAAQALKAVQDSQAA